MNWLRKLYDFFFPPLQDPVKDCAYYKKHGCAHIDGMLCDMPTCTILQRYTAKDPLLITSDYEEVETDNVLPNGLRLLQMFPAYAAGPNPTSPGMWLWKAEDYKNDAAWVPVRELVGCDKMQAEDQIDMGVVLFPAGKKLPD